MADPATWDAIVRGADVDAGRQITDDGYDTEVQEPLATNTTDACATFCSDMFRAATAPLLPRPASPPRRGGPSGTRGRKRVMVATRSSMRLAARPSTVPVAQRAQKKLMRELEFINTPSQAPDDAITKYIDMFGQELPVQAVEAIRAATRMDNKKLSKVLAAMTAESGAVEMDVF